MSWWSGLWDGLFESASDPHIWLDGIGMVPELGVPADLINAGLYAYEGDFANASVSLAATVVDGATVVRSVNRAASGIADAAWNAKHGVNPAQPPVYPSQVSLGPGTGPHVPTPTGVGVPGGAKGGTRAGDLPAKGKPGSTDVVDRGEGKGTIREYGPDGKAKVDYDFGHNHGAGDPHAHDWDWSKPGQERRPGRPLQPGE